MTVFKSKGSDLFTLVCTCGAREIVTCKQAVKILRVKTLKELDRVFPDQHISWPDEVYYNCSNCSGIPTEDDLYEGDEL